MQPDFELVSLPSGDIWAHKTIPYWIRPNEFDGFFTVIYQPFQYQKQKSRGQLITNE